MVTLSWRLLGDIRVSWGTVAIVTVPNSGIQRCARLVLRWLILGGCLATTQAIRWQQLTVFVSS